MVRIRKIEEKKKEEEEEEKGKNEITRGRGGKMQSWRMEQWSD